MKRTTLACTLAALLATGQSGATVTLNPDGLGQGLLFPFYSTENGQTTLVSVHNHSPVAKALKVRIMEGHAGAETLTFNVYVAAHARWSAALALPNGHEDATAVVIGNGNGCTVPRLDAQQPLLTFGFEDDAGPRPPLRTRRGYVEVVEMGTLTPSLAESVFAESPASCETLVSRMQSGGVWAATPNADLAAPTGGLRGDAVIMNTAEGTSFGYPALAFDGLATAPRQFRLQGDGADTSSPRLSDVSAGPEGDIRVSARDGDGAPVTLRYPAGQGYNAISALLASTSARGLYNIHPDLAARSEFVFSFPTKADHGRAETPSRVPLCAFGGAWHRDDAGVLQHYFEPSEEAGTGHGSTCNSMYVLQVLSTDPSPFPPDGGFASNTAPIFLRYNNPEFYDDPTLRVNIHSAIGSLEFDFATQFEAVDLHGAPDLDGKCWKGMPVWVWQVQTYDNANAQPNRISTFPESRVASRTLDIVDCDTLDD